MSPVLWSLAATAVSLAVMWLVCLRPMRTGRHHAGHAPAGDVDAARRAELAQLRQEVADLRAAHPTVHRAPDRADRR